MGIFHKWKAKLLDDWCGDCAIKLEQEGPERLYALPMMVGHHVFHSDAEYYPRNAKPIPSLSVLPTGVYACRIQVLRCPECGKHVDMLTVLLPVRNQEKWDEVYYFKNGELRELAERLYKQP